MASKTKYPYCLPAMRLRHRVAIESATTEATGEPNPSYSTLATVAAEVIETTGGEWIRGRQVEAGINALVTIRWRDDVTPRMRVKYGTRYLNIESAIDPTGYRSEMLLTCKEIQP